MKTSRTPLVIELRRRIELMEQDYQKLKRENEALREEIRGLRQENDHLTQRIDSIEDAAYDE